MPEGHVYILGSETGTLYIGVTIDFDTRRTQHRNGIKSTFATKYGCKRVLLYEEFTDIRSAIAREKEIKDWTRAKKLALIAQTNPEFKDLSAQHHWQMLLRNKRSLTRSSLPKRLKVLGYTGSRGILRFAQDDSKYKYNNATLLEKRKRTPEL